MSARSRLHANWRRLIVGAALAAPSLLIGLLTDSAVVYWLTVVPGGLGLAALAIDAENVIFGGRQEQAEAENSMRGETR